jgi:hypothetical protein
MLLLNFIQMSQKLVNCCIINLFGSKVFVFQFSLHRRRVWHE